MQLETVTIVTPHPCKEGGSGSCPLPWHAEQRYLPEPEGAAGSGRQLGGDIRQSACPGLKPLAVLTWGLTQGHFPCHPKASSLEGDGVQSGTQDRVVLLRDGQSCRSAKSIQRLVADLAGLLVLYMWAWEAEGKRGLPLRFLVWDQVRISRMIGIS